MPDPGPHPRLDAAGLRDALRGTRWQPLTVVAQTGSTNADLLGQLQRGTATVGAVLVAAEQVAGRGRLERSWSSPPGASVALSAVVVPPTGQPWTLLPLLAGLAVAQAGRDLGVAATIKWPNDVLVQDLKWCGILVQAVFDRPQSVAVVGIGVNVHQQRADLPVAQATSLALAGSRASRTEAAAAVLRRLDQVLMSWEQGDDVLAHYRELSATLTQEVVIHLSDDVALTGTAVDIAPDGQLGVTTAAGLRYFAAGDVWHVRSASRTGRTRLG